MSLKKIKNYFCTKCAFETVEHCECMYLRRFVEMGIESNSFDPQELQLSEYMQAFFPLTVREKRYNDDTELNVVHQIQYVKERNLRKKLDKECVV